MDSGEEETKGTEGPAHAAVHFVKLSLATWLDIAMNEDSVRWPAARPLLCCEHETHAGAHTLHSWLRFCCPWQYPPRMGWPAEFIVLCRFCHNDGQVEDLDSLIVAADTDPDVSPQGFWVELLQGSDDKRKAQSECPTQPPCMCRL